MNADEEEFRLDFRVTPATNNIKFFYECVFFMIKSSNNKSLYKHMHMLQALEALSKFEWVLLMIEWKSSDVSLGIGLTFIQLNL